MALADYSVAGGEFNQTNCISPFSNGRCFGFSLDFLVMINRKGLTPLNTVQHMRHKYCNILQRLFTANSPKKSSRIYKEAPFNDVTSKEHAKIYYETRYGVNIAVAALSLVNRIPIYNYLGTAANIAQDIILRPEQYFNLAMSYPNGSAHSTAIYKDTAAAQIYLFDPNLGLFCANNQLAARNMFNDYFDTDPPNEYNLIYFDIH